MRRNGQEYLPPGRTFWTDKKIYSLGDTVTISWGGIPIVTGPGWYTALFVGYPDETPCAQRLLKQGLENIAYRVAVGTASGKGSFTLPIEHCVGEYGAMICHFYLKEGGPGGGRDQLVRIYFTVVSEGVTPPPPTKKSYIEFRSIPQGAGIWVRKY